MPRASSFINGLRVVTVLSLSLLTHGCITMLLPKLTKKTQAEFVEFKKENLAGYSAKTNQATSGSMSNTTPATLKVPPKHCGKALFELKPGASYAENFTFVLLTRSIDGGGETEAQPGIFGPGGVGTLGCFRAGATVALWPKGPAGETNIGAGGYQVQTYLKPATEDELARAEAANAAWEAAKTRMQEEEAARQAGDAQECEICKAEWNRCMATQNNRSGCNNQYNTCTFKRLNGKKVCPKY